MGPEYLGAIYMYKPAINQKLYNTKFGYNPT